MIRWLLHSTNAMRVLLGFYVFIFVIAGVEAIRTRDALLGWRSLYYIGAAVIAVAVLNMTTK